MYFKIASNLIIILLLVVIQVGLVSALPGIYGDINILLLSLVFVLFLFGSEVAIGWALCLGVFRDSLSYLPFGIFIVSFILSYFLVNFLLNNLFTNRSLYSFLALSASAILCYKTILYLLSSIFIFFGLIDLDFVVGKSFLINESMSLLLNLFITAVIYFVINFLTKRLKPAFLLKR